MTLKPQSTIWLAALALVGGGLGIASGFGAGFAAVGALLWIDCTLWSLKK